jgi:hypothetical protein
MKPKPPKVRPSTEAGAAVTSTTSALKVVRFAATPSLVDKDLNSLLEICVKSGTPHASSSQKPTLAASWKKSEPILVKSHAQLDEDLYKDLRERGLKIHNQR